MYTDASATHTTLVVPPTPSASTPLIIDTTLATALAQMALHLEFDSVSKFQMVTDRIAKYRQSRQFKRLTDVMVILLKAEWKLTTAECIDHVGPSAIAVALLTPAPMEVHANRCVALARMLLLKIDMLPEQ